MGWFSSKPIVNENNCVQFYDGDKMGMYYFSPIGKIKLIPAKYDFVAMPSDGWFQVNNNGQSAYFNQWGKIVLPFSNQYDSYGDFTEGLARVMINNLWGYINKKGEEVISPQFVFAEPFSENRATVRDKNGLEGAIDKTGKLLIPFKYKFLGPFKSGYAQIEAYPNNTGIIDLNGNIIIEPIFYSIEYLSGDTFTVIKKLGDKFIEGTYKIGRDINWNNNLDEQNAFNALVKDFTTACEGLMNKLYKSGCPCEHPRFRDYITWSRNIDFVDHNRLFSALEKRLSVIVEDNNNSILSCPVCQTKYHTKWEQYSIALDVTTVSVKPEKEFTNNYKPATLPKPYCLTFYGYANMTFIEKEFYHTDIETVINYLSE
jgi:hypothetical protein